MVRLAGSLISGNRSTGPGEKEGEGKGLCGIRQQIGIRGYMLIDGVWLLISSSRGIGRMIYIYIYI